MDNDRITSMEQAIAGMQEQQAELYQKLEQFLKTSTQRSDPLIPTTPASPPPIPPKSRKVRPSVPTEFDGDHSKGIAFLNSCQTYIQLCPEDFADEQTKIIWAMSYMKSGRAQNWTAHIFRWEQQPECQRTPQSTSHYSHHRQSPIRPSTQTAEPPPTTRNPTIARPTCQAYVSGLRVRPTSGLRGHHTCPTVRPLYYFNYLSPLTPY